jgi:hypothetical protein
MIRTRLAITVVLLAFAVPQHAQGAVPEQVLAGTTYVVGSRTASIAVRLSRDVHLDAKTAVQFEGERGRMTAVVLKRDGGYLAPQLQSVYQGFCGAPGCVPTYAIPPMSTLFSTRNGFTFSGSLPAGRYRLYVVTDGEPVRVKLTFPGLKGVRTLRPVERATARVVEGSTTMSMPAPVPAMFAGGSEHLVGTSGGLNANVIWKRVAAPLVPSAVGSCFYEGLPRPELASPAYQTPCPGGVPPYVSGTHDAGPLPSGQGSLSFLTSGWLLPPSKSFGIGGYHNSANPGLEAHSQQLWLDFRN